MLFGLKEQLRIQSHFDLLRDAVPFRRAIKTGTVPRAFRIAPQLGGDSNRTDTILGILFDRLAAFGTFDSPPALFLSIDRAHLPAETWNKPFEYPPLKRLAETAAKYSSSLYWLPLSPLKLCEFQDFDRWVEDLKRLDNPSLDLNGLIASKVMSEIHSQQSEFDQPYPLRKARFALERLRL